MCGTIVLTLIEALLILLALLISKAIRFISPALYGDQLVAVDDRFVSICGTKDDVILTQTASPPSSHIVVSLPATKYDVFLSFRGEDTRHTFASYLYKGLCNAGVHTFMDYKLRKGEHISQVLLRTIEESEISIIIFSKNYASSTWCMDELVHILECQKKIGRVVIPIFYNVNPSNIRQQNGRFGNGFDELKQRFKDNPKKLQRWRDALIQSTSFSGWDSNCTRPEFKLVEEIVKDTLSKLNNKLSPHLEGLVGIARHIENVGKLLSEARIVGIWGMGGAGKTTLAKVIFQVLRDQFDSFSFIENVKEQLARITLDEFQQNCLKELLKDKDISLYDIKSTFVKNRLGRKKILLMLDDVDNSKIAADLIEVLNWFGEGSRIIITSRDMRVLQNASALSTYHVSNLDFHDAIHLFSLKAFKQHEPFDGYMELSKLVVQYCQGNPLALIVLGCFLCDREKEDWGSALKKLNQDPPKGIVDVLKLSFDGLDEKQQDVFLDLAFLINERVDFSLNLIRQLYDSSAVIEISVLREKSLISFNDHCSIVMHDLVKKMGLKIVRNQLISDAKTPIRLWRHEDIADFFNRGKGIEAIRCLSLDMSMMKSITLRASIFQKIPNLIFLKIYKSDWRKFSMLNICGVLNYLSEELRFLSWEECPLPYVPLHFCAENLITLEMRNSNIRQLWNGNQHFPNLEEIDLTNSKHLTALPDLSHAPKIQKLILDGCVNIHGVLNYLSEELRFLSWKECPLPYMPLHFCSKNLVTLDMSKSNIRQLWNGNQHFPNLEEIDLTNSKHLTALPDLSHAPKIQKLILDGCVNLAQIHSSTFLGDHVFLSITDCGSMQIKVGGSMKERISGVVLLSSYLDLRFLSFNKVTEKVLVCGNMICGVRFKHEVMPLEEIEELINLGSLLPFVRKVKCSKSLIEFGHDLNQHYDYYSDYDDFLSDLLKEMGDRGEMMNEHQVVAMPLMEDDEEDDVLMEDVDMEGRGDRGEMMNEHQVLTMSLMEDDEEDDVLMEDCCNKSVTFTRVPNSITHWSLLKKLTLNSLRLSNECCRRIKPHLDITLSFPSLLRGTNISITYSTSNPFLTSPKYFTFNLQKSTYNIRLQDNLQFSSYVYKKDGHALTVSCDGPEKKLVIKGVII